MSDVRHQLLAVVNERVLARLRRCRLYLRAEPIELTLNGACFSSGTITGASNEPSRPLVFSRTTTFNEKRPGGSVTPD